MPSRPDAGILNPAYDWSAWIPSAEAAGYCKHRMLLYTCGYCMIWSPEPREPGEMKPHNIWDNVYVSEWGMDCPRCHTHTRFTEFTAEDVSWDSPFGHVENTVICGACIREMAPAGAPVWSSGNRGRAAETITYPDLMDRRVSSRQPAMGEPAAPYIAYANQALADLRGTYMTDADMRGALVLLSVRLREGTQRVRNLDGITLADQILSLVVTLVTADTEAATDTETSHT